MTVERLAGGTGDGAIAALDDGRLLAGDGRDRRAQAIGVVEIDVRDGRDAAIPGVGRVETAAEADLHEGDVEIRLGEMAEHDRRQQLEFGRVAEAPGHPVGDRQYLGDETGERLGVDRPPVDLDPLAIGDEVRLRGSGRRAARRPGARCRPAPGRCPCRWSRRRGPRGRPVAGRPWPGAGLAFGQDRGGCRSALGRPGLGVRPRTRTRRFRRAAFHPCSRGNRHSRVSSSS